MMSLAKHGHEKIPWTRAEDPSREFGFNLRAGDQAIAEPDELARRLFDRDFVAHRMLAEATTDVAGHLGPIGGVWTKWIVHAPVRYFDSVFQMALEADRRIDDGRAESRSLELDPKRLAVKPILRQAPEPHRILIPLQDVVHTMIAGRFAGVKGRPDRTRDQVARRFEPTKDDGPESARKVGKDGEVRLDDPEVRGVDPKHRDLSSLSHRRRIQMNRLAVQTAPARAIVTKCSENSPHLSAAMRSAHETRRPRLFP